MIRNIVLALFMMTLCLTSSVRAEGLQCCVAGDSPVSVIPTCLESCCFDQQLATQCGETCCACCQCMKQPTGPAVPFDTTKLTSQTYRVDWVALKVGSLPAFHLETASAYQSFPDSIQWTGPPVYLMNDVFRI